MRKVRDCVGQIRVAEVGDAAAIGRVHVERWRTTYAGIVPEGYLKSLDVAERVLLWREWLARDLSVFVAEVAGEVVGFGAGGAAREAGEGFDAELYTLYLLEDAQGLGLGRRLLGAVAEALAGRGFEGLMVWVLERNPAVGFYEKMGAVRVMRKEIELGGVELVEVALGWRKLRTVGSL